MQIIELPGYGCLREDGSKILIASNTDHSLYEWSVTNGLSGQKFISDTDIQCHCWAGNQPLINQRYASMSILTEDYLVERKMMMNGWGVTDFAIGPLCNLILLVNSVQSTLTVMDINSNKILRVMNNLSFLGRNCWNQTETKFLCSGIGNGLYEVDIHYSVPIPLTFPLSIWARRILHASYSNSDEWIAASDNHKRIFAFPVNNPKKIRNAIKLKEQICGFVWTKNDKILVSTKDRNYVKIYLIDPFKSKILHVFEFQLWEDRNYENFMLISPPQIDKNNLVCFVNGGHRSVIFDLY